MSGTGIKMGIYPDVLGANSNSSRLELSFMNLEMASIPRTLALVPP